MDAPTVIQTPVARELTDRERQYALEEAKGLGLVEPHIVSCPYEPVGGAVVDVKRKGAGEMQFPRGEVVRCMHCHRYFEIGVRVQMYGKEMPDTR